jgi:hypothetical protein
MTNPSLALVVHYVHSMCDGATWTKNGHFLGMKPIEKIILPNIQITCMLEVHVAMTRNQFFPQKPNAFNCGTNGLYGGGAQGLNWFKDHSRLMRGQRAFVPTI